MEMKDMVYKIARMLRSWMPLMQQEMRERTEKVIIQLELKASLPPQFMWYSQESSLSGSAPLNVQPSASSAVDPSQQGVDVSVGYHDQVLLADSNALSSTVMSPSN
jgi:hypothetical protein